VLLPSASLTVTSTVPPLPAGATAVSVVEDCTLTEDAALTPNATLAPGTKFVPVMVTVFPPAMGPIVGSTALTEGGSYAYWSDSEIALVPPAVVTVTSTVPVPAGATASNVVEDSTFTAVAGSEPKLTVASEPKFVPVIVTVF
jgi:hypothetical protein